MKPSVGTSEHRRWVVTRVKQYSDECHTDINDIRRDDLVAWSQGDGNGVVNSHDLKALGGWARFRQYAHDEAGSGLPPSREELGQSRTIQHRNTHRRALERLVGDVQYITTGLQEALADAVRETPAKVSTLKKVVRWDTPSTQEVVLHVSDTHFGQCVDADEVYLGRYDWTIAARRMGLLMSRVVARGGKNTSIRMVFNGDLIEGKIHNDDRGVDMMASQIDGARQLITAMIDYARHHFCRVDVVCQSGNHERWPFRGPGRPTAQKYDSATTVVMRGVEQIFRQCSDVRFSTPVTPFSIFESCGWRFLATHGDDVFQVGNPSKSISLDGLFTRMYHMEAGGVFGGKINAVMLGHWHFPMVCRVPGMNPQPWLLINGCASGKTAYSQTLGLPASGPVQTFWEVTEATPVHNYTMVDLAEADGSHRYEDIVPVPTPIGLSLPKIAAATDFYAILSNVGKNSR